MSDLLAIFDTAEPDTDVLDELARRHPDRVTVLLEGGPADDDRLALLLTAIELRTGAAVVGMAGSRDQLRGWRFDRIVGGRRPISV